MFKKLTITQWLFSIRKTFKWLSFLLVSFLVLLGLACAGLITTVYFAHKTGKLQHWISEQLGVPVQFDIANVQFDHLEPVLYLENIRVIPEGQKKPAFNIEHVRIHFAIISSLFNRTLVTQQVTLSGVRLLVVQAPDGHYELAGFGNAEHAQSSLPVSDLWEWLSTQHSISLEKIHLTVEPIGQHLEFNPFEASWRASGHHHFLLTAYATLPQTQNGYIQVEGDINAQSETPSGTVYVKVNGDNLAYLFPPKVTKHLAVQNIGGEVESWLQWSDNHIQSVKAAVHLHDVKMFNQDIQATILFPNIQMLSAWKSRPSGGWQVTLEPENVKSANVGTTKNGYLQVTYDPGKTEDTWAMQASEVDVALVSDLIIMLSGDQSKLAPVLSHVSPSGHVKQLYMAWAMQDQKTIHYVVDGDLKDLSLQPWGKYPGLQNLSGHIHATDQWGEVQLYGQHFILNAPEYFNRLWPESTLGLGLQWQKNQSQWGITLERLYLHNPFLSVSLYGAVPAFESGKWPNIYVLGGVTVQNVEQALPFFLPKVPYVPEKTSDWLYTNIKKIPTVTGSMILAGPLSDVPFAHHTGVMQIVLHPEQGTVSPWKGWGPITNVDGRVLFNNQQLFITADKGELPGGVVNAFELTLPDMQKGVASTMTIHAQSTINDEKIEPYLLSSPLQDDLSPLFAQLTVKGMSQVLLDIQIPLGEKNKDIPMNLQGQVLFNHNSVVLKNVPLSATELHGKLLFTPTQVTAQNIQGVLFGKPMNISVKTVAHSHQITVKGQLNVPSIAEQFNLSPAPFVMGITPFSASIITKSSGVDIRIYSTLKGIAFNVPAPFSKPAEASWPSYLALHFGDTSDVRVMGNVGKKLAWALNLKTKQQKAQGLEGVFTVGHSRPEAKVVLPNRLFINGYIPYLSVGDWITLVQRFKPTSHQNKTLFDNAALAQILGGVDVNIELLNAFSQQFANAEVKLTWQKPSWVVNVEAPKVSGNLLLPADWSKPVYTGKFNYLFFVRHSTGRLNQTLSVKDMLSWPALNMDVKKLYWGNDDFGTVQLVTQPVTQGIQISNLSVNSPTFTSSLQGTIVSLNKTSSFNMSGKITANDWGKTFSQIGYPDIMKNGKGPVTFSGSWKGKLSKPVMSTIQGNVSFNLTDGALSSVNPGISRYLGLFNVGALLQRLSFNFSDLTESGLAFDSLEGDYVIKNGVASTQKTALSGPALNLALQGDVDLVHKTLNQTIVVMPQVGTGVALIAGLIGGPIAGVAVWVADKVIMNTILKNKGFVYHVVGPWNNPKVVSPLEEGTKS